MGRILTAILHLVSMRAHAAACAPLTDDMVHESCMVRASGGWMNVAAVLFR